MISVHSIIPALLLGLLLACSPASKDSTSQADGDQTVVELPLISGYYADPSVVVHEGRYYVYATIDPWGGDSLALFSSADFQNWERHALNWPTKAQCTSPQSNGSMVWAPGVIRGLDGKFHMFVSVGSEVYAGISDHPAGPWQNVKADGSPLIASQSAINVHTIDADPFIDADGQGYLYWGSGYDWKDGHCMVATLNPSMTALTSEPRDVTPPNYFEAPYMIKRNGKYLLMYSHGKCTNGTYQVRVSEGSTPYGPWAEIKNSPILATSADSTTRGPGHHTVLTIAGQDYILYHRIKDNDGTLLRELVIDSLNYGADGELLRVNAGVGVIQPALRP